MSKRARALLQKMSTKVSSNIPNKSDCSAQHDNPPLTYKVIAKCSTTKARVGVMTLRHGDVDTPVFMPVGTQVAFLLKFHAFISHIRTMFDLIFEIFYF